MFFAEFTDFENPPLPFIKFEGMLRIYASILSRLKDKFSLNNVYRAKD